MLRVSAKTYWLKCQPLEFPGAQSLVTSGAHLFAGYGRMSRGEAREGYAQVSFPGAVGLLN